MNAESVHIRQILVALDASTHSLAALEAAAKLASRMQASLLGLFVEDINLLKLAQLPFAHELRFAATFPQKIDTDQMEKQLQAQASQMEQKVRETAVARGLAYSFQVVRGQVAREVLSAAHQADLLVMGQASRRLIQTNRIGRIAQVAAAQSHCSVLLTQSSVDLNRPPLLIYDGTPASNKALLFAAELAQHNGRLPILIYATNEEHAYQLRNELLAKQISPALELLLHHLTQPSYADLVAFIHQHDIGLLILGQETAVGQPSVTQQSIAQQLAAQSPHFAILIIKEQLAISN